MTLINSVHKTILASIQRIAPEAHIAGGAVRDTILGKAIRDVDYFMGHRRTDEVARMLRRDFKYVQTGEWERYEKFSDPIIDRVAKFENADDDIPIAIIALKRPLPVHDNIARFDFGICMAAWAGDDLIETDAFRHDVDETTFTLHRADNAAQFAYSLARYRKLTADRYAGWGLAVPKQFEEQVKEAEFKRHWFVDTLNGTMVPAAFRVGLTQNLLRPKDRSLCSLDDLRVLNEKM